jgi:hypothetical protein
MVAKWTVIKAFKAEGGIADDMTFRSKIDSKVQYDMPFTYALDWKFRSKASAGLRISLKH